MTGVGWGQTSETGGLSTSQLITQRSIEKSAGKALAVAARRYINNGTTANRVLLIQAVKNYEEAVS